MISEIVDDIYIGDWIDAKSNANSFVTFTVAIDSPFRGVFSYRIESDGNASQDELFKAINDLYNVRTRVNMGDPILVHCVYGINRSAVVVAGYMMIRYNMSSKEAIQFIRSRRPSISPNHDLLNLLSNLKKF